MVTEVGKVIGLAAVMEVKASVPPVPRGPPLTVKDPRPRASLDPKDRTPLLTVVAPGKALVTVALLPERRRAGVGKLLMSTFQARFWAAAGVHDAVADGDDAAAGDVQRVAVEVEVAAANVQGAARSGQERGRPGELSGVGDRQLPPPVTLKASLPLVSCTSERSHTPASKDPR